MSDEPAIVLSPESRDRAEKRAREEGFESVSAYVDALIRDDAETKLGLERLRRLIEEGEASGDAGPMTPDKLHRLVSEGIALAARKG